MHCLLGTSPSVSDARRPSMRVRNCQSRAQPSWSCWQEQLQPSRRMCGAFWRERTQAPEEESLANHGSVSKNVVEFEKNLGAVHKHATSVTSVMFGPAGAFADPLARAALALKAKGGRFAFHLVTHCNKHQHLTEHERHEKRTDIRDLAHNKDLGDIISFHCSTLFSLLSHHRDSRTVKETIPRFRHVKTNSSGRSS